MLKFERAWCVGNIYSVMQKTGVSINQPNVIIEHMFGSRNNNNFSLHLYHSSSFIERETFPSVASSEEVLHFHAYHTAFGGQRWFAR
jgi:hypothetical protein